MSQIYKNASSGPPPPGSVTDLQGQDGVIVPPNGAGIIHVAGAVVAAGAVPFTTVGNAGTNTETWNIQTSQAIGATNASNIGLAAFNSADFTVDANGFVSLLGSATVETFVVDAATAPGTNPVTPNGTGQVTITGGQVAAGTTTNVIRTNSLAANTYTVQIQRSQAVASSTIGDNGVSHFNSANFSVDANGFVTALAQAFNYTAVTGPTTYVVLATDYYISCDPTAGAITLQFPNAPTFKRQWIIKDRTGTAATNNITLTTPGGTVTFDGLTSFVMNSNFQANQLLANATPTYEVY